jgi:hypothetical protein
MMRQAHVEFGEVEESRVHHRGVDIVIEPNRNVGRAELDTTKIDTHTWSKPQNPMYRLNSFSVNRPT